MTRPPLSQSSVPRCLASTVGWCSGARITAAPTVIFSVAPIAAPRTGITAWIGLWCSMCSPVQNES
jgi:hypothetical protein